MDNGNLSTSPHLRTATKEHNTFVKWLAYFQLSEIEFLFQKERKWEVKILSNANSYESMSQKSACNYHVRNGQSVQFLTCLANDSLHTVPNTYQQETVKHAQKQRKSITVRQQITAASKKESCALEICHPKKKQTHEKKYTATPKKLDATKHTSPLLNMAPCERPTSQAFLTTRQTTDTLALALPQRSYQGVTSFSTGLLLYKECLDSRILPLSTSTIPSSLLLGLLPLWPHLITTGMIATQMVH